MSHFTCTNSKINSESLLIQTLQACGLEVQRGAQIVGYQGTKSDTVFPIVGHSQQLGQGLGYIPNDKGFYVCHFHADSSVGALMQQVAQAYAARKALQDAQTMAGLKNANVNVRQLAAA